MKTWPEVLVDLDGHLHSEAKDCLHRPGDACRVCCPHADDDRLTEPEPADDTTGDFSPVMTWLVALLCVAVLSGVGLAAIAACLWFGQLIHGGGR